MAINRFAATSHQDPGSLVIECDKDGYAIHGAGTTVPTAGDANWQTGAIFIKTNGGAGTAVYINEGTTAAAAFNAVTSGAGGSAPIAGGAGATLTFPSNGGKTMLFDTATGTAYILPVATGSGARMHFIVSLLATSNQHVLSTTVATDTFIGEIMGARVDSGNAVLGFAAQSTSNTITLNRTTTGSVSKGEWLEVQDIAANVWWVRGMLTATGAAFATPFSHV